MSGCGAAEIGGSRPVCGAGAALGVSGTDCLVSSLAARGTGAVIDSDVMAAPEPVAGGGADGDFVRDGRGAVRSIRGVTLLLPVAVVAVAELPAPETTDRGVVVCDTVRDRFIACNDFGELCDETVVDAAVNG